MKRTPLFFLIAFLMSAAAAAMDGETVFQAGPARNTLVQVFTSDASAHCNPVLDWMTAQSVKDPKSVLWKTFVPVALHTSLWDGEGHKDSSAKPEFDKMLADYKALWRVGKLYPPTVATNGIEWSGWSRDQGVPPDVDEVTGVLTVSASGEPGAFSALFKPEGILKGEVLTFHACLLVFGQRSKPSDGRNRGKSLQHEFLVRQYRTEDFRLAREGLVGQVQMNMPKIPRSSERYGVAFWVTKKDSIVPVQAAGGFLRYE